MLNVRNTRIVVAALVLITVLGYLLSLAGSFSELARRVQLPVSADKAISNPGAPPKNAAPYTPAEKADEPEKAKGGVSSEKANEDALAKVNKPTYKTDETPGFVADKGVGGSNLGAAEPKEKPAGEVAQEKQPETADDSLAEDAPAKQKKPEKDPNCKKTDYVVMIDAGLTGSRVHVYAFDTCVSPPALLKEEFKMLKPGLSSFDTDVKGAAASLDPLMEVALATVPKDKQACTPVAVKATAGLRLLGKEKADAILGQVRTHLEEDYPFAVVEGDGISIMEGKDEGVYAWITTNYLLGNIGTSEKIPTAAVFDLGGGSTQIVFEPDMGDSEKMAEGEHKYEFSFGDRDFTLYQFSHLGYGLMEGRNKVNALVVQSALKDEATKKDDLTKYASKSAAKDQKAAVTINNPCMAPGVTANDVVVSVGDEEVYVVNFKGPAEALGAQCRFLAEKVLNMDSECTSKPCSFNGVYQPSLVKAFHRNSDMWVFSYFYDRTNPLGFPASFTVEELRDLTKMVCAGEELWKTALLDDGQKELKEEPHWCLDLSFITAMLHTGYNIPLLRELRTAKTIANNELGWCLGASLPLLNPAQGGWKCRVVDTTKEEK